MNGKNTSHAVVIPDLIGNPEKGRLSWIPAFAGMTERERTKGDFDLSANSLQPWPAAGQAYSLNT